MTVSVSGMDPSELWFRFGSVVPASASVHGSSKVRCLSPCFDVALRSGRSMFVHEYLWASSVYSLIGLASGEGRVSVVGAHSRESFDIGARARGEQLFGGCSLPGLGVVLTALLPLDTCASAHYLRASCRW